MAKGKSGLTKGYVSGTADKVTNSKASGSRTGRSLGNKGAVSGVGVRRGDTGQGSAK